MTMKKTGYKTIVLLLVILFPFLTTASGLSGDQDPKWNGRHTGEKSIKRSFNVNSDALLQVDNSYGNIYITSWDANRIEVDVLIKVNGNNQDKIQQKLDQIDVRFEGSKSTVSAKTIFGKKKWYSGNNNNVSIEINYTIKLPVNNSVDLTNDYGSIRIDQINGKAKISCDYGKLDIGELRANGNDLSFDYTTKSSIGYMKSGRINADYSGFVLEKADKLTLNADYTSSEIHEIGALEYACSYGDITVKNAKSIHGNGDYLSARFGTIHGNMNIESDYGSIKIEELAPDAGDITLNTEYTGIKIGYNNNYHFNFEIRLEYSGLKDGNDLEYAIKRVKSSEKYYKGHYGSSPGNRLSVTSEYGGVTLYKK